MKIHVVRVAGSGISGYTEVLLESLNEDLQGIADNQCIEILAGDALDAVNITQVGPFLQLLMSKLRLGGKFIIGGTDINMFAKAVLDGSLPEQEYCSVIEGSRSMTRCNSVVDTIRALGLTVEIFTIDGIHFQVTARRV